MQCHWHNSNFIVWYGTLSHKINWHRAKGGTTKQTTKTETETKTMRKQNGKMPMFGRKWLNGNGEWTEIRGQIKRKQNISSGKESLNQEQKIIEIRIAGKTVGPKDKNTHWHKHTN